MPEYLRALVVLMILAGSYFFVARRALVQLVPEETFKRWRNLWLVSTLVLFLSHSIWIYMLMLGAILLAIRGREAHVMGLYFVLLFVAPPVTAVIPGLGIIDHVWTLDHYRLLGLTLLLPAALSLFQRTSTTRLGKSPVDWMVLGYVSLMSFLAFREDNVTNGLRMVLSHWVDIFLPYYVASRSIRTEDGLKHAMTGYVIAAMLVSIVAIFEVFRSWMLYQAVLGALGIDEYFFGNYLTRSGLLRPRASIGNSIVVGYVLVVALGFFLYVKEFLSKPLHRLLGGALLTAGVIASLSRGPWVGAALLIIIFIMFGPRALRRLIGLGLGFLTFFLVLSQSSSGQLFIDMLPVVGGVEQNNVEYRANLLMSALPVIERNLIMGSNNFLSAPELQVMINGDGIIDVVNTYIGVTLHSGLMGLTLFLGAFLFAMREIWQGVGIARQYDSRTALLGRALFATVSATILIIYTTSSILVAPVVYWSLLGLGVAYAGVTKDWYINPKETAVS